MKKTIKRSDNAQALRKVGLSCILGSGIILIACGCIFFSTNDSDSDFWGWFYLIVGAINFLTWFFSLKEGRIKNS